MHSIDYAYTDCKQKRDLHADVNNIGMELAMIHDSVKTSSLIPAAIVHKKFVS